MKTIVLFSDRKDIYSIINICEYHFIDYYETVFTDSTISLVHCLFIFDPDKYISLSEQIKKKLRSLSFIILSDDYYTSESVKSLNICMRNICFCPKNNSAISNQNIASLIDAHFTSILLTDRLNNYIQDSFQNIVDSNILEKQKEEIEELNKKLSEISRIDHLTNLLNRRALMEAFENEKKRAIRDRWRIEQSCKCEIDPSWNKEILDFPARTKGEINEHIGNFSCIMADIDHFKKINDTYGHLIGDMVLRNFGDLLRQKGLFRENDIFGRYGGEEFIILLPETNYKNALIPAERLREAIKKIDFKDELGTHFTVSLSLGVAEFLPEELSCDEMIKRADLALYYAKEHGRDQVCVYSKELDKINDIPDSVSE
ncbi:MAG: hypothetical protein A2355_12975 [Spirochaetes bacterium RIFOXYB1_FULL_32_8]|nr:MAG: hypothetical protein A2Y30_16340 [Spirochaetes bacterium GWE1_32_154]OHD48544.1 MAG: hypothetical protein A2Y29_14315 [Spirochaetes bacterium GWE2_31_10]OHD78121.1 MAG: hypothetical protein A2355_12975 [Spirochaetes bacterium RIFOXYB1_FULL_32_8]HBD93321.1 hypothetical protein [Spirochaetia bacterium]HBI36653.1 hypothetical protein [Spirochaetia bacterium]